LTAKSRNRYFGIQAVDKPLCFLKMGCRVLLALLVLHRAKLLASNQSILALGRSPRQGLGAVAPAKYPLSGGKGFGDRDNKSEVYFKNRLFLQAEILKSLFRDFLFIF